MRVVVLTVDQRASRSHPDAVPALLDHLRHVPTVLPFTRTVGDEVQGVLTSPEAVATAVEALLRDGGWHVGIGLGEAETPLPPSAPEARGSAFVAAREAVSAARTAPWHLRVVAADDDVSDTAEHLESALWLWAALLNRRSEKGWEVADLLGSGLSHERAGARLGISQSAVSQRAQAAHVVESRRAHRLVSALAGRHLHGTMDATEREGTQ